MLKLFLLATTPFIVLASSTQAAPLDTKCLDHVENIDLEKAEKPSIHTLGKERPAAQIAAVERRIDSCSILVVINPQLAGEPRWTAPSESPAAKKHMILAD